VVFGRKKMEGSCFFGSGAAWSSPKHALSYSLRSEKMTFRIFEKTDV
jgi:hypothetical protein